jgi:hypothetical protein
MTHSIWKRQLKCDGPPVGGLGETGGLQVCTANYIEIGHRPYVCVRFALLVVFVVVTVCGLDHFGRGRLL